MVVVSCPTPGCPYETSDEEPLVVAALLNIHAMQHTQAVASPKGPKLNRPQIDSGVDQETWNAFVRRWNAFRTGSGITDKMAPTQLLQCASESLGDTLLKTDPEITTRPIIFVLETMRTLAVIPTAIGVLRAELMQLQQSADENFRTFAARVKGKAETCDFTVSAHCPCGTAISVNYTEEAVRDVLLAGISDLDIRREALSTEGIQTRPVNEIISFVEGREMARNATPETSLSTISSFRKGRQSQPRPQPVDEKATTLPCPDCGRHFHPFKEKGGVWNTKPHKVCLDCWRARRRRSTKPSSKPVEVNTVSSAPSTSDVYMSQVSTIGMTNKIFTKGEWRRAKSSDHPTVTFDLEVAHTKRSVQVEGIADTGAQSNLWGLKDFLAADFPIDILKPVRIDMRAANKNPINVVGAFSGLFGGQSPCGKIIEISAMVYVSDSVTGFYLSFDTMVDLRILNRNFPVIGNHPAHNEDPTTPKGQHKCEDDTCHIRSLNSGCANPTSETSCKCPQRTPVPAPPSKLPFEPVPENNLKMRDWLLNHYASSTFNTCPHRPLQCMAGPPLELHIEENVTPRACHTAAPIPMHWQNKVYEDLIRDEALGVIERVPYGEPVLWCHRMVVTRKHDGTPRRTVDLSPLNKYCKRETFSAEPPFHLARRIPGYTWKTVTDAWNGYHSVPLRECDRHLTTFITPFGRWRYTRAPQGFLSSGDGYNRRFDAILSDFPRKERCVDDTILYDEDLATHWWRTIEFLSTVGSSGVVLNPDKFQFAQKEVDFAGFQISERIIKPLPKYTDAIASFPTPKSTTDIRSWFGLVNQVSNYAQLRDVMSIFRPFLSPKYKFFWTPVLDRAFEDSRLSIIEAIRHGVEIFDMSKPTCLRPDWSCRGIGYFLLQQHCSCATGVPDCCQDGWKITLAGSRFLSDAEQRYAPIEGEALAIAWGLEQTKYFTQGCPNLLVVTDHKPLTKIFSDRTLDEIPNTRLFRLKQRTLPWHFRITHLPGKSNVAADATSRHPTGGAEVDSMSPGDCSEMLCATSICRAAEDITSIPWTRLADETAKDFQLSYLIKAILGERPYDDPCTSAFQRYKDSLYTCDGVILYNDRVVVPKSLRQPVLEILHSAHQGVSTMELRAQSIVFWPGMTNDIKATRAKCQACNRNAPSQAPTPTEPAIPPTTPFEQVFADFFEFGGRHYLVIGDRLSGWSEIFATPSGSPHSGARGLTACLRTFFSTFGVPEELSSDGGPEFTASVTSEFLRRWGVRHRISSAYFPQSNGRAEVAVKSAKRLLRSNVGPTGTLDNDNLLRALLELRNTPDPDCNVSPAQIVFGRPLRDAFSFVNRLDKFSNRSIHPIWRDAWSAKESALRTRFMRTAETLSEHTRALPPLSGGDKCFLQNQTGPSAKKWDRTGTVMEVLPYDQYIIKVDGSGRLTKRNRRFLRTFEPASTAILPAPSSRSTADPNGFKPASGIDTLVDPVAPLSPVTPTPSMPKKSDAPQSVPPCDMPDATDHATPYGSPSTTVQLEDTLPANLEDPPASNMQLTPANEAQNDLPRALKRLLPHNNPGLKETRPRQRRKH